MNLFKSSALIVVAVTALWAVAAAPVAVRVEIETLEAGADGTPVVLTVQISPEDRSRIGENAMVRVALDGDAPPGQSPLWAVRIEGDGSGRIETVWPPGEHALRVEISNPSGEDTGLWVGTVRIPGPEAGIPRDDIESPATEQVPAPEKEIEGAAVATGSAIAAAPSAPPAAMEPAEASESIDEVAPEHSIVVTDESAGAIETVEPPPEPEILVEEQAAEDIEEPANVSDEVPVDDGAEAIESERTAEDSVVAAGAVGTAAISGTETSVETPAGKGASEVKPPAPDAEGAEPNVAVVEPLRAAAPQSGVGTGAVAAPSPESLEEAPKPPPAEVVAALAAWNDADPATADLTVIALRDNEPATGLTPSDFSLRVGGKDAMIEDVGGRDRAPLQLGIVVDVATGSSVGWSLSGGRLFPLVQRARGGHGHVFFAAGGRVGEWDGGPGDPRDGAGSASSGDVTSLIIDSLERFEGRRGRKFLVVVTDGRIDADKTVWKRAADVAETSGVPVLIIALWDENFSQRIRKNLKTIANSSGGGLFLVQGSDQLDRAAERFGPMIDAGVALRFVVPPGVVLPAAVSVNASGKSLEVSAPEGVR